MRPQLLGQLDQCDEPTAGSSLAQFAGRPLADAFPYLILDARYERVREAGVILSQAVLIAIGLDWHGRRQVLAVEVANRESRSSWRDLLPALKGRGLHGVEFVVADDHAGLRAALREILAQAANQRRYVELLKQPAFGASRSHAPTSAERQHLA